MRQCGSTCNSRCVGGMFRGLACVLGLHGLENSRDVAFGDRCRRAARFISLFLDGRKISAAISRICSADRRVPSAQIVSVSLRHRRNRLAPIERISFADRRVLSAPMVSVSLRRRRKRFGSNGRMSWHERHRLSWQIVQNPDRPRRRSGDRVGPRRLCDDKRVAATASACASAGGARGTTASKALLGDGLRDRARAEARPAVAGHQSRAAVDDV